MSNHTNFDVSVVIPLFNKAPFIRATIASVLAQSLQPRAIVVVDDESTDGSAEIVDEIRRCHPQAPITLLSQENAGPGPARNRGIVETCSEWVAMLDGDDLWGSDHLATLCNVERAFPSADLIATGFRRAAFGSNVPLAATERATIRLLDLFATTPDKSPLSSSCVAVRRRVLIESGGFGPFWPGEDFELWARLALDHAIAFTDRITATYIQNTGGLMEQHERAGPAEKELQPIFGTLEAALADPRYVKRHEAIRGYRAALLTQVVRQALFRGRTCQARELIACNRSAFRKALLLKSLSLVPPQILKWALQLRRHEVTGQN